MELERLQKGKTKLKFDPPQLGRTLIESLEQIFFLRVKWRMGSCHAKEATIFIHYWPLRLKSVTTLPLGGLCGILR